MRLFGYDVKLVVRKVHPNHATELRHQLFDKVEEVNALWKLARKEKLFLNLWMDWQKKQLVVTKLSSEPARRDEDPVLAEKETA